VCDLCYLLSCYGSANESCYYGDWTNLSPGKGKTAFCSRDLAIENWEPKNYTPYVYPPCIYSSPPGNRTTPIISTSLINPSDYDRSIYLDPSKKYKLYWSIDFANMAIKGAVEVETPGWVGLGISAFGMEGADVFIGWVKDNVVYFKDRFATKKQLPDIDPLQDFYDITGAEVIVTSPSTGKTEKIIGVSAAIIIFLLCIAVIIYFLKIKGKPTRFGPLTEELETADYTEQGAVKLT